MLEETSPSGFAGSGGLRERDVGSLPVLVELLLDKVDLLGEHRKQLHRLLIDDSPDDLCVDKSQSCIRKCM